MRYSAAAAAGQEAVVPATPLVILTQHDEQLVRGGMDAGGQFGDALAELVERLRYDGDVRRDASRNVSTGKCAGTKISCGSVNAFSYPLNGKSLKNCKKNTAATT